MRRWELGSLQYEVLRDGQPVAEATLDASAAAPGWNLVGGWSLDDGELTVALSNATDGELVMADAIRWVPAAANGGAP